MGQVRRQPNRRAHCDQVKTKGKTAQVVSCLNVRCKPNSWGLGSSGPSGVRGGALLLFPGMGSRERSGRDPMPVLPIHLPMDEVHGVFYGVS